MKSADVLTLGIGCDRISLVKRVGAGGRSASSGDCCGLPALGEDIEAQVQESVGSSLGSARALALEARVNRVSTASDRTCIRLHS